MKFWFRGTYKGAAPADSRARATQDVHLSESVERIEQMLQRMLTELITAREAAERRALDTSLGVAAGLLFTLSLGLWTATAAAYRSISAHDVQVIDLHARVAGSFALVALAASISSPAALIGLLIEGHPKLKRELYLFSLLLPLTVAYAVFIATIVSLIP